MLTRYHFNYIIKMKMIQFTEVRRTDAHLRFHPKIREAADIVSLLTQIHEYKGEQTLFIEAKADALTKLVEIAKIQSTEASNKIEGIYTSDERLKKLVQDKTTPRTRNEQEIAVTGMCWPRSTRALIISRPSPL